MDGPIASAVVLPEPQEMQPPPQPSAPSPTSQKRRQSSASEQDAKRPRLNDDDNANADAPSATNNARPTAPAAARRERGRERRLFGAALGALSQNSATTGQKRRSEIEKRQLAQRKLEEEESEQRKQERIAQRRAQRQKEQKHFEKESMRVRHRNLLSKAHFLRTDCEPRLYYKPWELTPQQESRIRDQIAEAQETIRREVEEYEAREAEESERERQALREGHANGDADADGGGKESNAEAPPRPQAANGVVDDKDPPTKNPEFNGDHAEDVANEAVGETHAETLQSITSHEATAGATDATGKDQLDETGEEVLEAAEDTVIY